MAVNAIQFKGPTGLTEYVVAINSATNNVTNIATTESPLGAYTTGTITTGVLAVGDYVIYAKHQVGASPDVVNDIITHGPTDISWDGTNITDDVVLVVGSTGRISPPLSASIR